MCEQCFRNCPNDKNTEINRLIFESYKAYEESIRQEKISKELLDKALNLAVSKRTTRNAQHEFIFINISNRVDK